MLLSFKLHIIHTWALQSHFFLPDLRDFVFSSVKCINGFTVYTMLLLSYEVNKRLKKNTQIKKSLYNKNNEKSKQCRLEQLKPKKKKKLIDKLER